MATEVPSTPSLFVSSYTPFTADPGENQGLFDRSDIDGQQSGSSLNVCRDGEWYRGQGAGMGNVQWMFEIAGFRALSILGLVQVRLP